MELLDPIAIERLANWLDAHFTTRKDAAQALLMTESNLSNILKRKRPFGPKYRKRFEELGGNWVYIITGMHPNAEEQKKAIMKENEEKEILKYLRSAGLDSLQKVEDTLSPILLVAEKVQGYNLKKKKK